MSHLSSLPVVVPFLLATGLAAIRPLTARWFNDVATGAGLAAVIAVAALLAAHTVDTPIAYWLGGWRPSHGVSVGIALAIDPLGAGLATFALLLVGAAVLYSLHYFDSVNGLFHVLMLLFAGAMAGFCLTGDLFNMVVFFELMGAVAYALTAHRIEERAPIEGAINFAITNSVAGYAMFIGTAMLYARTGALNMAQIGATLDGHGADTLVIVAMALLFAGFLTKAAVVPLHFWLADAHAVAPTPVCVLFSGVMIELGVYAVARLYWVIFAGPMHGHLAALKAILIAAGVTTALTGALMCTVQRHVKRLLAFSSISHVGLFVCGVGLLDHRALAGVAVYVVGHGLVKAALFMCAGVLLHRFATIDEFDLHGCGRELPITGGLMALGALLLAGVPPFTTFAGKSLLEASFSGAGAGWLIAVAIAVSALTGGAVLRVTGRVFLGLGPAEGPDPLQERAAREEVDELQDERGDTPRQMLIAPGLLMAGALALALVPGFVPGVERMAARFADHAAYGRWVLAGAVAHWPAITPSKVSLDDVIYGLCSTFGALAVAAVGLFGRPLREALPRRAVEPALAAVHGVRRLHSGHIGDYIAWWTAGAGVLGGACLLALR
ncbi:MAG TPA: complex I subunit 5 family protein [Solirubrobacteraceae bacterium]